MSGFFEGTSDRPRVFRQWKRDGGIMIMSYPLLVRVTSSSQYGRRLRYKIQKYLTPDVLIMDEGHQATNPETATYAALSDLKTKRKIILTGTPLQNNLREYAVCFLFWCIGLCVCVWVSECVCACAWRAREMAFEAGCGTTVLFSFSSIPCFGWTAGTLRL